MHVDEITAVDDPRTHEYMHDTRTNQPTDFKGFHGPTHEPIFAAISFNGATFSVIDQVTKFVEATCPA